ncbi:MAG: lysophospholipid acyltransferase family protein [Rhizobiaceae bacterium]|jgi:hypothetical protein|nr:lysophospholipid acyltransferase family protein [Rhizobiaceae bacterium]
MTSDRRKKGRRKTFRKFIRRVTQGPVAIAILSRLAYWYLKLVVATNRFVVEPPDALERVRPHLPVIVGVWHGQHILMPAVPIGLNASAMISRNFDGEVTARVVEMFGNRTIRASGGREQKNTLRKGGMTGFLDMMRALEKGDNVVQTADIPQGIARRAGLGIVMLAQRSHAPIVPLAIASSRRLVFSKAWDRAALNLPFGTTAIVMGDVVEVPANADDAMLEQARQLLEQEMQRITGRAYALTGKPE